MDRAPLGQTVARRLRLLHQPGIRRLTGPSAEDLAGRGGADLFQDLHRADRPQPLGWLNALLMRYQALDLSAYFRGRVAL